MRKILNNLFAFFNSKITNRMPKEFKTANEMLIYFNKHPILVLYLNVIS
jgi:hypothetical protein